MKNFYSHSVSRAMQAQHFNPLLSVSTKGGGKPAQNRFIVKEYVG